MTNSANIINPSINAYSRAFPAVEASEKGTLYKKISTVVKKIFTLLKLVFCYPLRFLGSKDWSLAGILFRFPHFIIKQDHEIVFGKGFERHSKDLGKKEGASYIKYGAACAASYQMNVTQWTEPFGLEKVDLTECKFDGLPETLEIHEGYVYDPVSGLKAMITKDKKGELIVSFGAVNSADSENKGDVETKKKYYRKHMTNIALSFAGAVPSIYHDADRLLKAVKNHQDFRNKRVVLTGSCYGASLASYCGLNNGCEVFAFNPLGLGPGIQNELGKENLEKADRLIRIISAKGDYTSNHKIIGIFDRIISLLGIRTAGSFGKRFQVPSAYQSVSKTHRLFIHHLMQHVGFDCGTKPYEISRDNEIFHQANPFDR